MPAEDVFDKVCVPYILLSLFGLILIPINPGVAGFFVLFIMPIVFIAYIFLS